MSGAKKERTQFTVISKINDRPVTGALCSNCKLPLESFTIDTNQGKQTLYVCTNENCKLRYLATIGYFPPAETAPAAKKEK